MAKLTTTKSREPIVQQADKLYLENTLLRIAGALFCHDPKRAAARTGQIEVNKGVTERHIVVRPDPQLGQPGPLAHRIFVALIKKHSDYGRPIQSDVSFTKRELMRLAGRKEWGGADSEQLSRALTQIQTTLVATHFKDSSGRFIEERFHIFSKTRIERREFASDPIEACIVTLADPIIASLQDNHFTCLNHSLMMRLGTIGQALYMRLFFHFANRFDGNSATQLTFTKRYDDICIEWLGGLTIVRHRSKIIDRLGPHFEQLKGEGVLASYQIQKARTREGFVITFRPGPAFFHDYDRFYGQPAQGELQWHFHTERREISEPLKVAYLFAEKRTGQPANSIAFVPSKDVETAKLLLAELSIGELPTFMDYALREARKTQFDVQSLGGIKQYLAGFLVARRAKQMNKAQEAARLAKDQCDAERNAYDRFRRAQAAEIFRTLPIADQAGIEAQARAYAISFNGSLRDIMFASKKIALTFTRHGNRIKSFDQWAAEQASA